MSIGLTKKGSSSESSYDSKTSKMIKTENVINFDKIRNIESSRRGIVVRQCIEDQNEIITKEEKRQEGLKRLAQVNLG